VSARLNEHRGSVAGSITNYHVALSQGPREERRSTDLSREHMAK